MRETVQYPVQYPTGIYAVLLSVVLFFVFINWLLKEATYFFFRPGRREA